MSSAPSSLGHRENGKSSSSSGAAISKLTCKSCGKRFVIGEDAVAVCLEFGLHLPSLRLSRDPAFQEDVVCLVETVPLNVRRVVVERATGSWAIIRSSLSSGDFRTWACDGCQNVNGYELKLPMMESREAADDSAQCLRGAKPS